MYHGFIYDGTTYTTLDHPDGAGGTRLWSIDQGTMLGDYFDNSGGIHGFLLTSAPSIVVEEPAGTPLVSDTSIVDFGNGFTVAARPVIAKLKFIIKNTGKTPLMISDVAVASGPFQIASKPGKKVAPGKNTSFTAQMTPNLASVSVDGSPPVPTVEHGELLIFSDDSKTPIFHVKLTGNGGGFTAKSQRYYFSLSSATSKHSINNSSAISLANPPASGPLEAVATLTLAPHGWLSGRIRLHGVTYTIAGAVNPANGSFTGTTGNPPLPVSLQLVPNGGGYSIAGTLGSYSMSGDTAAYTRGQTVAEAGSYSLVLKTKDPSADVPQGAGYATMRVTNPGGRVIIVGRLADGTAFSSASLLLNGGGSGHGRAVLYNNHIYGGKGLLAGTINFEPLPESDCDATLTWIKPPRKAGAGYQPGFATDLTLTGTK